MLSKDRGNQPLWVWIMILTAHGRRCVYCDEQPSQTLEHEVPLAGRAGRDVWWNLVPACDRCNNWKQKRSAVEWALNMKLHHTHPKAGFARHALPLRTVEGIRERVIQVQREIRDPARRQWFEHHYGRTRTPRLCWEKHEEVQRCTERMERYPYPPWESQEIKPSMSICMRVLCCGYQQPDAHPEFITLAEAEREDLRRMAYEKGWYLGDLIGSVLERAVQEWRESRSDDRSKGASGDLNRDAGPGDSAAVL
ncbi:HNH endonuclease [Streptomyces griseorubiginosus]|uniref:HNH endonuclease n=1 Tax=Streptomyces griseorubiginosus TaxID=67304 RepID=UPI0034541B0B